MEEYASKVWQHCVSSSVALMETGNVKPESIDIIVTAPSTINNQERLKLQKVAKTLLNGVPTVRVLTTQQLIPQNSSNEVVVDLSRSQNLTVTSDPAFQLTSTKSFNDILKVFCRELDGGASDFSWGSELTAMVTRREAPWDCLSKCLHQHCAPRNNTEEVFDEDKDVHFTPEIMITLPGCGLNLPYDEVYFGENEDSMINLLIKGVADVDAKDETEGEVQCSLVLSGGSMHLQDRMKRRVENEITRNEHDLKVHVVVFDVLKVDHVNGTFVMPDNGDNGKK